MATEGGAQSVDLEADALKARLRTKPQSFSFFQAVRLLERLYPEKKGVGLQENPLEEVVRFRVDPSLAFPANEIERLEEVPHDDPDAPFDSQYQMWVNFMGLVGPQGVLPFPYTEEVQRRNQRKDPVLGEFLDLFHHRMISLFYRAWKKHHLAIAYEEHAMDESGGVDRLTGYLMDLLGINTPGLSDAMRVPREDLVYYGGLFARQPRSAIALEQLLEDVLKVRVEIQQFVGNWYTLSPMDLCTLSEEEGPSSGLGETAILGDEIWDVQSRVRLRVGPLTRQEYDDLRPGGEAHSALRRLTRFFSHDQFDFEIQLVLAAEEVPGVVLGGAEDGDGGLGWSTWVRTQDRRDDAEETIFTLSG